MESMESTSHQFPNSEISLDSILADEYRNEDEIIGYVEPWVASPGQQVEVKVSSTAPKYTWSLVRIIQGLEHPKAPDVKYETILKPSAGNSVIQGSYKRAHCGSYALVNSWKNVRRSQYTRLHINLHVEPWLVKVEHEQTLISTLDVESNSGFALCLSHEGKFCAYVGDGSYVAKYATGISLRRQRWAQVDLSISQESLTINVRHCERLTEVAPEPSQFDVKLKTQPLIGGNKPLTMAAGFFGDGLRVENSCTNHFNGRLDSPRIQLSRGERSFTTWAEYDFSVDIPTDNITDVSGGSNHGVLINAPTRAVKGHNWDGSEPDWTKAKSGYGAIHFHEDDLEDAGWATDFTVDIPPNSPSGAYAVVVKAVDNESVFDYITFFVRPLPSHTGERRAKAALVLSTFTYLAYGNEHMYDRTRESRMELAGGVLIRKDQNWRRMARRDDLGCSLYDVHRDGSGCVFSSAKRPILNIRPSYVNWAFHRPREFSADQLMIAFLEQRLGRGGYDVLTDHDLHVQGVTALDGYSVVMTGCHPEYPSLEILDAYAAFAKRGGHIMYLGGNGFYWCSAVDPARCHRVEVRKGDQGCRSITMPAGERINSLNGAQGGLWRSRGRAPQILFGIGSCACGNGPGVPYRFSKEVRSSPKYAWLFEGFEKDQDGQVPSIIGTEGFGGGASGDEIDRLDFSLGSPSNTILLATSTGHDDSFGLFNEEIMYPMVNTTGTVCDKIRSDMIIYDTTAGGSVFSVGSINWYCSLGWNKYENNVARLTWNVLREFLSRGERSIG